MLIATSWNLLNEWGYDVEKYKVFFTEFWVQQFAKNGGEGITAHTFIGIITYQDFTF